MVRAFAFFGGVPKLVKFDNMRVAVTKPDRYSPDFTLLVQQLAEHYQTTCTTARVGAAGQTQCRGFGQLGIYPHLRTHA